ncbi:hypothetical protein [Arthrobacter bambusae]|uniref:Uncharacterized protein n=1 Tax=Arthrobacter bambusae TaxID=1338426 RepID=A0AAW8DBZ9_9MICC|nr:hypothetical protein [Arthrobacter bambusae]MDP9903137.1 hypothetical protein [Arthrobacter bambusae]MDQ0128869.1 hypothetical protein [Arthrobacter bambusae]MDQ0180210.1 hypothetical protein [Arthrobacter bambusae]
MNGNPAVAKAYNDGDYTDARGVRWERGINDGWFNRSRGVVCVAYHEQMVALIEKENPR